MTYRTKSLREIAALCEIPGPEDGVDPRHIARRANRSRRKARTKDLQLAREAGIAVRLALPDLQDQKTEELDVVGVEPAPDASHLRVLIAPVRQDDSVDFEQLGEVLARIEGGLRASIAQGIHRKRAPTLSFVLVPHPAHLDDEGISRSRDDDD